MPAVVQQLRTTDATKIPAGLEPGQVAFNLTNHWMFVGLGNADIIADGATLTTYNNTQTILGVSNINVPAKPAAGKGYEIYPLETTPYVAGVFGITDALVNAGTGATTSDKITGALVTAATIPGAAALKPGDLVVIAAGAGGPFPGIDVGSYVWDGTKWMLTGGSPPDATTTGKGLVQLGLATDLLPSNAPGATSPNPLAVATAAQLKGVNTQLATVLGGTALLGTYDASTSTIEHAGPEASAAGRTGLADGAALVAGAGLKSGDYFVITKAGTIANTEPNNLKGVVTNTGDTVMYDGAAWSHLATGPVLGGTTIHGCADVSDATVGTVASANVKGILVRDDTIADGLANAYKLVSVLDLGSF